MLPSKHQITFRLIHSPSLLWLFSTFSLWKHQWYFILPSRFHLKAPVRSRELASFMRWIHEAQDVFHFRLHFSTLRTQQSTQSFPSKAGPADPWIPGSSLALSWAAGGLLQFRGTFLCGNRLHLTCSFSSRGNFCCLFCSEVQSCNILTNCLHL